MKRSLSSAKPERFGFSLLELLATVTLMGIVMAIVVPRFSNQSRMTRINACHVQRGNIEVQAELWYRQYRKWPARNLKDIGQNDHYFPDGLPVCPVDGSHYRIDRRTGHVEGHDHQK